MPFIEYSDRERSAEKVWATAPRWAVLRENRRRKDNDEPELRCHGLHDEQCTERQLAWNKEADIKDRIRLAKAEALLADVRSEIAKSK